MNGDMFEPAKTVYCQKYDEGYNAYERGVELGNNPYDPQSQYGILWGFGWCKAADKDDDGELL